jgi:hypothetical protein
MIQAQDITGRTGKEVDLLENPSYSPSQTSSLSTLNLSLLSLSLSFQKFLSSLSLKLTHLLSHSFSPLSHYIPLIFLLSLFPSLSLSPLKRFSSFSHSSFTPFSLLSLSPSLSFSPLKCFPPPSPSLTQYLTPLSLSLSPFQTFPVYESSLAYPSQYLFVSILFKFIKLSLSLPFSLSHVQTFPLFPVLSFFIPRYTFFCTISLS